MDKMTKTPTPAEPITPAPLVQVERLVMQYAQNRVDLKVIKSGIGKLLADKDGGHIDIDLSHYRDEWYEKKYAWAGWLVAVEDSDHDYTEEEKELAKLLDAKAKNRADAGQIKRNIYAAGIKLIKSA